MQLKRWFKNLRKWQKGGLIGCAVGLLFAILIFVNPGHEVPGGWVVELHFIFGILIYGLVMETLGENHDLALIAIYGGLGAIVIVFYSGLGALWGRIQQVNNPSRKWLLTALLALFLLSIYCFNYVVAIILEHR